MVKVIGLDGKGTSEVSLPKVFSTPFRPDVIQRAVLAIQSHKRQPYGVDPRAGLRSAAHFHGVKDTRYSMKNKEIARMPRSHNTSPAQQLRARIVPQAVSGRKAHPPKAYKVWAQKMNKKENVLAIKSAIAATTMFELVSARHTVKEIELPIIITDKLQEIQKTSNLRKILGTVGCQEDLERAILKKVRPGKGTMRGRRYKRKTSVLIVVSDDKGLVKAASNIPGVDVCHVKNLNVELLAPGTQAGRLTIWSESSIKQLGEIYG
ncbi:MAG: 50S ribosomal protein L4 [Candidatus Aenigmarchaeota archaeon]|nr:50S ribosomal protein L4 [Candidatus Aenigmarchaeota archaeon]